MYLSYIHINKTMQHLLQRYLGKCQALPSKQPKSYRKTCTVIYKTNTFEFKLYFYVLEYLKQKQNNLLNIKNAAPYFLFSIEQTWHKRCLVPGSLTITIGLGLIDGYNWEFLSGLFFTHSFPISFTMIWVYFYRDIGLCVGLMSGFTFSTQRRQ